MTDNYELRNRVYKAYESWMIYGINDAIDAMIIGKEIPNRIGLFQMAHLLMQMRNENYASCRPLAEDMECLRERLFCMGVDITVMEEIFPPSYDDTDGSDLDDSTSGLDGVGYMQIQGSGTTIPINRVN